MLLQGQVGPQATTQSLSPTQQPVVRLGNLGELIFSELHGRYYETTYRKNVFSAATPGVTTTVGLATTYTGLCLSNPIGSPVNLVVNKVGISFLVAFAAAAAVGIMVGFNSGTNVTHTTPVTPQAQFVGGPAGYGLVDSSATLPTAPTLRTVLMAGLTGAITTAPTSNPGIFDLEGSLVIPPGGYAAIYTSTASGASGLAASWQWEEVPV